MGKTIHCVKLDKDLEGLDFPPMPGELGQKIFTSVSKLAWQDWINHQTMIINENRLNLAEESARSYLRQQLEYYFFSK